jgi:hypothetical protein
MGYDYTKKLKPEGQIHGNACWAASISWWLRAMALVGKRRQLDQVEMIDKFSSYMDYSGGVSPKNIKRVCESAEVRIELKFVTPDVLKKDFKFDSPCLIIFNYPKVGGTHMNVIFNQIGDTVACMEPFYPHPGEDGLRSGQYVRRPLAFFCNSPEVGVGYQPLSDFA